MTIHNSAKGASDVLSRAASGFLAGLLLLASACGKDDPAEPPAPQLPDGAVPEVHAPDVNSTSARFGEDVSPRDYVGSVSAWYFGQAT